MATSAITPQWVINDIAREFRNRTILTESADRSYDPQFKVKGAFVGAQVQARLPYRPRGASGARIAKQQVVDQTTPLSITDQYNVGIELSTYTLSLEKGEIRRTVINPCVNHIVQYMEAQGFSRLYKKIPNSIGTLGVSPTANLTYAQGVAKLNDMRGDSDDLTAILSSDQSAVLADAQKGNANVGFGSSRSFKKGEFSGPMALGIETWKASPNVAYHTTGTFTASTPLVNVAGGVAEGASSMVTDGWASGATSLKEGDVFTVANVYEINSASFTSTGRLRQFTLTADVSDTTGAITMNFSPAMYASGPQQNVNALPADNAAITVWGANPAGGTLSTTLSRQGLIFAPGTVVLCMADAATVDAPVCEFARDEEAGISMRLTKSFDIDNDNNLARLDIFFGWNLIRPEWGALRVQGA
jgi:hypothetical protein